MSLFNEIIPENFPNLGRAMDVSVHEANRSPHYFNEKLPSWASLVAQWLRICLPMQGTWVRALVWEDPTCRGTPKPMHHNY